MAQILIADDEEDVGIIVREYLEPCGHQVSWAPDGGTAWEMFQKNNYDLIILDLRMPVMDGYAVCDMIKKSDKKNIPVLFLSCHINERGFRFKSHADDFVTKPFSAGTLVDAVHRLLRHHKNPDEDQRSQNSPKK